MLKVSKLRIMIFSVDLVRNQRYDVDATGGASHSDLESTRRLVRSPTPNLVDGLGKLLPFQKVSRSTSMSKLILACTYKTVKILNQYITKH